MPPQTAQAPRYEHLCAPLAGRADFETGPNFSETPPIPIKTPSFSRLFSPKRAIFGTGPDSGDPNPHLQAQNFGILENSRVGGGRGGRRRAGVLMWLHMLPSGGGGHVAGPASAGLGFKGFGVMMGSFQGPARQAREWSLRRRFRSRAPMDDVKEIPPFEQRISAPILTR